MREKLLILFLIFYFIIPLLVLIFVKNSKIKKVCAIVGLAIFIPILLAGVFCDSYSLEPGKIEVAFKVSGGWCNKAFDCSFRILDKGDFYLNAIMLFPIGIVIAVFSKKPILWSLIWGLIVGTFLETMQFVLPIDRYPQFQDLFLNALGVVMGGAYVCLINMFKKLLFTHMTKSKINKRIKNRDAFLPCEREYYKTFFNLDLPEDTSEKAITKVKSEDLSKSKIIQI